MNKEVYEYMSEQMHDPIVERRSCQWSGEVFPVYACDKELLATISPTLAGKKYALPFPEYSPWMRMLQRQAARNNRFLYKANCDLTGTSMISTYSPEKPFTVYNHEARHSDDREAMQWGRVFDASRGFFDQFAELFLQVPKIASYVDHTSINCSFANGVVGAKNCYLSDTCSYTEDLWYCSRVLHAKNCMDCYKCEKIENCYECVRCRASAALQYCIYCKNCSDCFYSVHLDNCQHCFACSNLVNSSYCFQNKQLSKEEYHNLVAAIDLGSHEEREVLLQSFQNGVVANAIFPATSNLQVENCMGDSLTTSRNCLWCFDLYDADACRYCTDGSPTLLTAYDSSNSAGNTERVFNSFSSIGQNIYCCRFAWNCQDVLYSESCGNCQHLFACVGLQNKSYCIFNKQYTKQSYYDEVHRIITAMQASGERGKFFPSYLNTYAYNETVAYEYDAWDKRTAQSRGYMWQHKSYPVDVPEHVQQIKSEELPDHIEDAGEGHKGAVVVCPVTQKVFRIAPSELMFYRRFRVPLSRIHYDERYRRRKQYVPQRNLYLRNCDKTGVDMVSVYPQGIPFNVYAEDVYTQEVYG